MSAVLKTLHLRRTNSKSNVNCCVFGCNAVNKKNPELSFHKFPPVGQKIIYDNAVGGKSETDRRKLWEFNLKMGKAITPYMYVCSRHFTSDDYITPDEDCYTRRFLKKTSVPTQHLPARTIISKRSSKLAEERSERIKKRRGMMNEFLHGNILQSSENIGSESNFNEVDTNDAAEILLSLSRSSSTVTDNENCTSSVVNMQFQDCSTQTEESSFSNNSKHMQDNSVQVDISCFSISSFINNDKALNILTGLPSFNVLFLLIHLFSKFKKDTRTHRFSVKDRILLVFMKLKLDLCYSAVGILFGGVSVPTVKRTFYETVENLAVILKEVIYLPSKENILMNMPICFQKFQKVRVVLDCTEIQVQVPRKLCCRIKVYSHYKKHHTVKFMTGVTPAGMICYVSPSYGGRASDKSIFEQSNLLQQLEPFVDQIMVDKGFIIDKVCEDYGIEIVRPPFLRMKKQFNKSEALQNKKIAAARVHIERVNARIKIFRILRNTLPLHLFPIIDEIFTVICAIVNVSNPVIRENLFIQN